MNLSESTLIERSLTGDSEAFGGLVTKYQGLICAVTYSLCGNVSRSEELAQETFVTAWKNLRSLKDQGKFKSWLCGIARNLARSAHRSAQRDASAHTDDSVTAPESQSTEPLPDVEAMAADEASVVWNALAQMPENYREPMVLFYREDQSVGKVAEALDLSQDAVKQRLSRGRALLKDRVASMVEGALVSTRPGPAFVVGVLTALPLLTPTSASAAAIAAAVKDPTAATSAASASWLAPIAGGLVGVLGGWFGYKVSMENCQSDEERRELKKMAMGMIGLTVVFAGVLFAIAWGRPSNPPVWPTLIVAAVFAVSCFAYVWYWARRMNRVRQEFAPVPDPQSVPVKLGERRSYESKARLLGIPLLHLAAGSMKNGRYRQGTAKGWIALGDIAISPFLAVGGFALGPLAMGGMSIGLLALGGIGLGVLSIGGLALGGLAFGGAAVGYDAFGGFAMGAQAAVGGMAVANDYAVGGQAIAAEANTAVARAWVENQVFFESATWLANKPLWILIFIPIALIQLVPRFFRHHVLETSDGPTEVMTKGWIAECPRCGYAKPLAAMGGVRVGAASYQKRTVGFCSKCRRFRLVIIRHLDGDPSD